MPATPEVTAADQDAAEKCMNFDAATKLLEGVQILLHRFARANNWFFGLHVKPENWPDWVCGAGTIYNEMEGLITGATGVECSDDLPPPEDPGGMPKDEPAEKTPLQRLYRSAPRLLEALRAVVADACQGCGDWERGFDCRPPECLNACGNLREAREAVYAAIGESHA